MIARRDFWVVLVLSIITCGIYYWVYLYRMSKDLNTMAGEDGQTVDPTLVVVLTIITCGIYEYYWLYKMGNRMQNLGRANNIRIDENGTTYLLWKLLGYLICGIGTWVGVYLFIKNFNTLADGYNYHTNPYNYQGQ